MKEDFVSYDLAVKLKEKGFSEKCLYHYTDNKLVSNTCKSDNDNITTEDLLMSCNYLVSQFDTVGSNIVVSDAPTIYQVFKWLREEKNLSVEPYSCACGWRVTICKTGNVLEGYISGGTCVKDEVKGHNYGGAFDWYEQAALAGIEYVIDNLI